MSFSRIEIDHFRGIKHASIDGFKTINLFVGKNNCGKSSLLDSIFLASGLSNPLLPIHVNFMRGYNKTKVNDLKLDFYNLDVSQSIHIRLENNETRDLKISLFEFNNEDVSLSGQVSDILSNVEKGEYGLRIDFEYNGQHHDVSISFKQQQDSISRSGSDDYKELLNCLYLNPKFDFEAAIDGLNSIIRNKDEGFILDGLRIIEPRVIDFLVSEKEMVVDVGAHKRIPINLMGDGARKIVALLTAIYSCKSGVLLIDEISNGFHYSVMKDLWKVLIKAAIRNETQLFITTHDIDSIIGLRDAALENVENNDIATVFKLVKRENDDLESLRYSMLDLDYLLSQRIELR